jgi:hypothetical protein
MNAFFVGEMLKPLIKLGKIVTVGQTHHCCDASGPDCF